MHSISIIICTRNRADDLHQTLDSLAQVDVSPAFVAEVLLVDNGSTDETRQVAEAFEALRLSLRSCYAPERGKARALNEAALLRHARGDVLLFTDDDVRFPNDWIACMSAPILSGETDAVVLTPYLTIAGAFDAPVEHHCDPNRIYSDVYLSFIERLGRSHAYVAYHWHHAQPNRFRIFAALTHKGAILIAKSDHGTHPPPPAGNGTMGARILRQLYYQRQLLREAKRLKISTLIVIRNAQSQHHNTVL